MANVNVTAESGTSKNIYTQDAELVMVGPVAYNASGDSVTITDAKEVHFILPCTKNSTSTDVFTGTGQVDYSEDPGRIYITPDAAAGTGEAFVLVYLDRDPS